MSAKIKLEPQTRLERAVAKWARDTRADYNGDLRGVFGDLFRGGCQSGMVSGLVYYCDTCKFCATHRRDIDALLAGAMGDAGVSGPADLFGDKWDKSDPLAREMFNQNLLAWFGFEEAARALANRAGIEV